MRDSLIDVARHVEDAGLSSAVGTKNLLHFDAANLPSKMPVHDASHDFISASSMLCGVVAFAISRETAHDACPITLD